MYSREGRAGVANRRNCICENDRVCLCRDEATHSKHRKRHPRYPTTIIQTRIVSSTIVRRLNPGKWPDLGKHRQDCFFFFFACAVKRRQIRLNAAIGLETEKEGKGKEGERRKRQEGCVYRRGKGRMRKKRNRERVRKGAGSGE